MREWLGVACEWKCSSAGPCVSVLAVNVIVFWLGLSGVPSSGLVEILAALTSPSLSQSDSWWDLRRNARRWIASNIHASWISLRHPLPLFPPSAFHSTPTSSALKCSPCSVTSLSSCLTTDVSYNSQGSGAVPSPASWAVVFHGDCFMVSLCHNKSLDLK